MVEARQANVTQNHGLRWQEAEKGRFNFK